MKQALIISNIKAGRKTAIKCKKIIHEYLLKNNIKYKFVDIEDYKNIDSSEFDTIIAIGGDGTINKALSDLINSDKTLGIIPCGTANLLAARLGISTNIKKALKIIHEGKTKKIDTLSINNNPCILRFGLGYDSDIIIKTPQSLKNKFGYFSYFVAGMLFALRLKRKEYNIIYNGKTENINATCVIVANAPNMYQNMASVAKKSTLDDGLFDVFILKASNPITFVLEFLRIMLGIIKNNKQAKYFKAKELQIKNKWSFCHIDGEKLILDEDITVKILPQSVRIFSK